MRTGRLVLFFWGFGAALAASACHLGFEAFAKLNSPASGIIIKQVKSWYTPQDVESIKEAYPQPKAQRRGKIVVFSSDPKNMVYPDYLAFYLQQRALKNIAEKMRLEILQSLSESERKIWENKKYDVALQWSDGTDPLSLDHVQHVHRDQLVATLTLEGVGTIAKLTDKDISKMDFEQVYTQADGYPGHTYQAAEGELVIINGVHYPSGGLHAAPQVNGKIPSRLTVLVGIEQ